MMRISIRRHDDEGTTGLQHFEVALEEVTLLRVLEEIKTRQDASLTYSSGCQSTVCGSCAMRVNGTEVLACTYKPKDGDVVEPLRNMPVIRDLVVDSEKALSFNRVARAWSSKNSENITVMPEDEKINEVQSDCILCGSCYSACPVYAVNEEFIGPFALTRSWRYVSDVREQDTKEKIEAIQTNGVWDCTLCNECVPVCPEGIAPKQDIQMLRGKSGIFGFMDPNFGGGFGGGGLDFGGPVF